MLDVFTLPWRGVTSPDASPAAEHHLIDTELECPLGVTSYRVIDVARDVRAGSGLRSADVASRHWSYVPARNTDCAERRNPSRAVGIFIHQLPSAAHGVTKTRSASDGC